MTTELLLLLLERLKLLWGELLLLLLLRLLSKSWLLLSKLLLLLRTLRTLLAILRWSLRICEGLESLISELIFLFESEPLSGSKDEFAVAKLVLSLEMGEKSFTLKGRDEGRRGRGCGGSGGWGRGGFSYNLNYLFGNDNLLFGFFFRGNRCNGFQNNFLDDIKGCFWNSGSSFYGSSFFGNILNGSSFCGNSLHNRGGGSGKYGDVSYRDGGGDGGDI